jgi:hypothetical protein
MTTLSKSLERRVQELRTSIEAQKIELAAYERVLELESKGIAPAEVGTEADSPAAPSMASSHAHDLEFSGSRSDFVASILKNRAGAGSTPQEIAKVFAMRKIPISKNLIYNVVSLLFKQKKIKKSGGRYYYAARGAAAAVAAPAASHSPAASPKKRRISEEGMRRIIAATKKRWAAVRAAKAKGLK